MKNVFPKITLNFWRKMEYVQLDAVNPTKLIDCLKHNNYPTIAARTDGNCTSIVMFSYNAYNVVLYKYDLDGYNRVGNEFFERLSQALIRNYTVLPSGEDYRFSQEISFPLSLDAAPSKENLKVHFSEYKLEIIDVGKNYSTVTMDGFKVYFFIINILAKYTPANCYVVMVYEREIWGNKNTMKNYMLKSSIVFDDVENAYAIFNRDKK